MTTIKNYIKDVIRAHDPTLDLSDSSTITDLLVNPASSMLDPVVAQLNYIVDNLGLRYPDSINPDELDQIASNFLISREQGSKASGFVEIFYNNPQDIFVPKDTSFITAGGLTFLADRDIFIPADVVSQNIWNYPRYSSGPISVIASDYGSQYTIGPNEIVSTSLNPAPAQVTNTTSFAGGTDAETNLEFVQRLVDEVITGALGSPQAISTTLRKHFTSIQNVAVKGMQDTEMIRDLVASGISLSSYYGSNIDFYGKISGLDDSPYPESIAYWGLFYDDPATSGLVQDLPLLTQFTDMFTNDMYSGIYRLNDTTSATIQTLVLMDDHFDGPLPDHWFKSDALLGINQLLKSDEISIASRGGSNKLQLGNYTDLVNNPIPVFGIPSGLLLNAINYMRRVAELHPKFSFPFITSAADIDVVRESVKNAKVDRDYLDDIEYLNIIEEMLSLMDPAAHNNLYPIIHSYLSVHGGIEITGNFETNDASEHGRMCYITVLRDPTSLDASNGYGFAWRLGDGTDYNVYLVDNSPLADDLFVTQANVIQPQGDNAWKAAGKKTIIANTRYSFRLKIEEDYAMSVKIWQANQAEPQSYDMNVGAPVNGPTAVGTDFGIGILGTANNLWWFDDLLITTSVGTHTAVVFKMKAKSSDLPDGTSVTFNYYGYGSDGEVSPAYGITMFAWRKINNIWQWIQVGTNDSTNSSDKMATKISSTFAIDNTYRDAGEFCSFLVTSTYSQGSITQVTSYYVNLQKTFYGVHTGGCADIYINDTSKILIAENTLNNVTGDINLTSGNGFYIPIHSIVDVQTAIIGDPLVVNQDWVFVSNDPGTRYSNIEYPYLSFDPGLTNMKVKIRYRYWMNGPNVQNLLSSDTYRYSGVSNLAKIMPPAIVTINSLQYRGSVTESTVINALKNYINTATETISLADIVNILYNMRILFVDIPNADIMVETFDYLRVKSDPVKLTTSYTLPTLTSFFADDVSLAGVRRL